MATIVLVRHGVTSSTGKRLGGWTDTPLDDRGRGQVADLAARLEPVSLAAVYASPVVRAQETAKLLASSQGLRVRTRDGLAEVDYGEWTDRALGHLRRRKDWRVIQSFPSRVTFPAGESIRAAQARAVDTLEGLAAEHGDDWVAAVSHADVIKALVAHYLAMPLDAFQRLVVAPASITVLHLPEGGMPVLSRLNDTGELAPSPGKP